MPDLWLIASLVGGLVLLGVAGDILVTGAVSLARKLGVSPLVAGLVIVGVGTSLPEMIVSLDAALNGYPDLALGNIVGSNIANVWLVLAVPALIAPVTAGGFGQRRTLATMLIVTGVWIAWLAYRPLTPIVGILFLSALAGYIVYTFASVRLSRSPDEIVILEESAEPPLWRASLFVALGLVGLPIGARLIVDGGVGVAQSFGVSDEIIGLTLLAVGTSLPEIGAGVAAALRARTGVLIGNILGSNLFNILGAGGIVSLFGPVMAAQTFVRYDHWALAAAALTLGVLILTRSRVSRLAGAAMLLIYGVYIYGLVSGWNLTAFLLG